MTQLTGLQETLERLSAPVDPAYLSQRKQGGTSLTFISWHKVNILLDELAPGWSGNVVNIHTTEDSLFIVYRITIPYIAEDGTIKYVQREATGYEALACGSYGDPTSNAESMAFRRAAARFGLGLYLYDKEARESQTQAPKAESSVKQFGPKRSFSGRA
jgi:hypothetical protein